MVPGMDIIAHGRGDNRLESAKDIFGLKICDFDMLTGLKTYPAFLGGLTLYF